MRRVLEEVLGPELGFPVVNEGVEPVVADGEAPVAKLPVLEIDVPLPDDAEPVVLAPAADVDVKGDGEHAPRNSSMGIFARTAIIPPEEV